MPRIPFYARLALATLALCAPALGQAPKVGEPYKDKVDLGFKVKMPAEWEVIPPQPGDPNLIAKYDPPTNKFIENGGERLFLHAWVLKFDRRAKPEDATKKDAPKITFGGKAPKDILEWVKSGGDVEKGALFKLDEQKDFVVNKIPATEYQFVTPGEPKTQVRLYCAVYKLRPDVEVGVAFVGPGDPKKWSKYEGPYQQMIRSFGLLEMADTAGTELAADAPLRDRERARLVKECAKLPGGWKVHETLNYFVITPHTDRAFVKELQDRLEAIRALYERDYPAAKAEEFRKAGEGARTGDGGKDPEAAMKKQMDEALFGSADARELSRCSVVRVFTDQSAYMSYGAPPGSAGYWAAMQKELVLYDDQAGGGRNDTWSVLNHEGFHQYIFYFFGNLSPHSWYNEGTGDFYAGYQYKNKAFALEKFKWRTDLIKEVIRTGEHVPLKDFVRFSQPEYYGGNKLGASIGNNYAQGWAFVYFLRTGKKHNAKNWDAKWDGILEQYLKVLAMTGSTDKAVEEAFLGVDMDKLEASWKDYTR